VFHCGAEQTVGGLKHQLAEQDALDCELLNIIYAG